MSKLDERWDTFDDARKDEIKKVYDEKLQEYKSKGCAQEFAEEMALNHIVLKFGYEKEAWT